MRFVRLNETLRTRQDGDTCHCLIVVSTYAPTACSSDKVKFYRKLSNLLQKAANADVIIVARGFSTQIGQLNQTERHLVGSCDVVAQRIDNGYRLLQLSSDNCLFLANTNFKHKAKYDLIWRPPQLTHKWTQIDHIAVSHRWRSSIEDCSSFGSTCLDSDNALVRSLICLYPTGRRKAAAGKLHIVRLNNEQVKNIFQEQLKMSESNVKVISTLNSFSMIATNL